MKTSMIAVGMLVSAVFGAARISYAQCAPPKSEFGQYKPGRDRASFVQITLVSGRNENTDKSTTSYGQTSPLAESGSSCAWVTTGKIFQDINLPAAGDSAVTGHLSDITVEIDPSQGVLTLRIRGESHQFALSPAGGDIFIGREMTRSAPGVRTNPERAFTRVVLVNFSMNFFG